MGVRITKWSYAWPGRKFNVGVFVIACQILFSTWGSCAAVESALQQTPDSELLSRWIIGLQFSDPRLPSYGALRIHHDAATIGGKGTRYYRVSPYNANLGVLGLLNNRTPQNLQTAKLWIEWYFSHLTEKSAPDGVPFEHFYEAHGGGETTCVKVGDRAFCHYNDATDSAAATFFSVLWKAHQASVQAGVPVTFLNTPGRKQQIEKLADVLLKLQQPDDLCWAKLDYRAKYLEDNCEVYAGLRDLAALEQNLFHDNERAQFYRQAALRVQEGILRELYDPQTGLYHIAKFEDGKLHKANLDVWYADTQAQLWPHLWGVVAPGDTKSQAVVRALNAHWNGKTRPNWATAPSAASNGWIEAGVAYAMLLSGNTVQVQAYLQAVKQLKFAGPPERQNFVWPFSIADAGWLLHLKDG